MSEEDNHMITKEHLQHWMNEIQYAINGIDNEISNDKLKGLTGISVAVSPEIKEDVFVSFEYLQEKARTIKGLLGCIANDMVVDEA